MFKVDDATVEQVLKKFNRTKKSLDEDVTTIEKWLQQQPHLLVPLDRRSILNFLILNKTSVEKSKQKIDNYYTIRTHMREIYEEMNPELPHMKETRQILYFVPHPQLLDHRRVFLSKVRDQGLVQNLDPYNALRCAMNIHEMRLREDVLYGEIFIVDCSDFPLSYFLKVTPKYLVYNVMTIYKKIYSLRLHALYFINFPSFGEKLITTMKTIIKPKIFERIHVLSDSKILKQVFSEDFLPEDFGGRGASLEKLQETLENEFKEHQEFFDDLENFKVDEALRPEKLRNDELLGFYGNFRRLDID
ncbi:hypothetical protein Zmor_027208 [Zophobas morio]|uniref:CRAL-TRIO domain-containing protein n=1 Tax=Zophobas morio TaxID=2755281 RepID=A0AA38HNB3_9CUCU|nr:hypothetical protein Zmor_027208 [Zophobas morio]